jgi:hypothetical protein
VVRKFTGRAVEPYLPLPNVPEYWFAKSEAVDGSAGLHRFIWDLRYDSPKALPASYFGPILQYTEYTLADHAIPHETPRQQPQGPLVVPGVYTVELSVAGQSLKKTLNVKLDPRVHTTQLALELQSAAAQRIVRGMQASYDEFHALTALTAALEEAKKTQKSNTSELEKTISAVMNGTEKVPGPGIVNRDLSRLLFGIESADQRPTAPQLQAIQEKCAALTKNLEAWKSLNEQLTKDNPLHLPAVPIVSTSGCEQ